MAPTKTTAAERSRAVTEFQAVAEKIEAAEAEVDAVRKPSSAP